MTETPLIWLIGIVKDVFVLRGGFEFSPKKEIPDRRKEQADQEKNKAEAAAAKEIAVDKGEALKNLAIGQAAAYAEKIKAFDGVNNYLKALALEKITEIAPNVDLPTTLVIGAGPGEGINQQLLTPVLSRMIESRGSN